MANNINIYSSLNEWKDSNDYLMQKWFKTKENDFAKSFESGILKDLEYDGFDYEDDDFRGIYYGTLSFNEPEYEWKVELVIDSTTVVSGLVAELDINLKCYDKGTTELINTVTKHVNEPDLNDQLIMQLVGEFKTLHIDTENNPQ